MISIFFAIVLAGGLSVFSTFYGFKDRYLFDGFGFALSMIGVLGILLSIFTAIVYAFSVKDWLSAEYKAQIINREYQTNYTQEEVFWAKDVIDIIRQIDRQRIELNGNLMNNQCQK